MRKDVGSEIKKRRTKRGGLEEYCRLKAGRKYTKIKIVKKA